MSPTEDNQEPDGSDDQRMSQEASQAEYEGKIRIIAVAIVVAIGSYFGYGQYQLWRVSKDALSGSSQSHTVSNDDRNRSSVQSTSVEAQESSNKERMQAVANLRRAAEDGQAEAQYKLALEYERGTVVEQNFFQTYAWARKAAEQGFGPAQHLLGTLFQRGYGVVEDNQQALEWYRKAADQGLVAAQLALSDAYAKGIGTEKDDRAGFDLLLKAAQTGDGMAQYRVGNAYLHGVGVAADEAQAKTWFEKAAKQDNREAAEQLRAIEKQAAEQEKTVKTQNILAGAYDAYLTVKTCYESKQGYIIPTVGFIEFEEAKRQMRKIEDAAQLSKAEKDKLWEQSIKKHAEFEKGFTVWKMLGGDNAQDSAPLDLVCQKSLGLLRNATLQNDGGPRKRDF